jgi:hypothetical protein
MRRRAIRCAIPVTLLALLAGCSKISSPDIFAITRSGGGRTLTVVVNDGGAVRCNGGAPRAISDSRLLQARKVANDLHDDASGGLRLAGATGQVYSYRYRSADGTIEFADTATAKHPELARAVLFATRLIALYC